MGDISWAFVLVFLRNLLIGGVVVFILYKLLLRVVGGKPSKTKYAKLHPINEEKVQGTEVLFYYELSEKIHAKFQVLDANYKVIAVLVDEEQIPGQYPVRYDTKGLADGAYLYQLITNKQKTTKKFEIGNNLSV